MKASHCAIALLAGLFFLAGYYIGKSNSEELAERQPDRDMRKPEMSGQNPVKVRTESSAAVNPHADLSPSEVKQLMLKSLAQTDRLKRLMAVSVVLDGMTEENAAAISEAVMERYQSGFSMSEELGLIHYREGQVLKRAGLVLLPNEPNGKVIEPTKNKMKGWASADPQSAKAWLDTLEPGTAKDALQAKWLEGLSGASPQIISGIFGSLPPSQQRALVGGFLNGLQNEGGFTAMRAWFDAQAKETDRTVMREAFQSIMWRMGQSTTEWDAAVAMFMNHGGDGFADSGNFGALTRNIAPTQPGKCLDLLSDISAKWPDSGGQVDSMISRTIEQASITSLSTVGTWLNDHKEHPLYHRTVHQFALRTKADDPESAMRWAETIKDVSLRTQTIAALSPP